MKKIIMVFQIAATFIGTIVGAGFASGREIVQFFTQYQAYGTAGAALSGVLLTWIGVKMMVYTRRIGAYSFNELVAHLFGERLGTVIEMMIFFIIFGMNGVMLAGAGAVFQEQLGWHRQFGILLAVLIGVLFLLKGVRGLLWVNTLVVPVLIVFVVTLFFFGRGAGESAWAAPDGVRWFVAAISYAAFNMLTALVVLVPLAKEIDDEAVLRLGGLFGGLGLTMLIFFSHFLMIGDPNAAQFDMPMAEIVRPFGSAMHFVFVVVIFGEILTTFIGNVFGLARQLRSTFPAIGGLRSAMMLLIAGAFLIGQAGYGSLVGVLYPLYGILCLVVVLYMLWVRLPKK
ncbi:transporter [Sporolactobacillus sp. THM7-7]|nr:transporter [Sporolactobacillus sp. THM7-7]